MSPLTLLWQSEKGKKVATDVISPNFKGLQDSDSVVVREESEVMPRLQVQVAEKVLGARMPVVTENR